MYKIDKCRVCGSDNVEQFFDLGHQPFANALLEGKDDFYNEKKYPLSLSFCNACSLVQLDYTADPKELFENYFWVTATSNAALEYADFFAKKALERKQVKSYVLEIASNDGTFLRPFKRNGIKVLGVDPAKNIAEMAIDNGIETVNKFFSEETAKAIINEKGFPSIVFARNVLPHVANLHDFTKGLKSCMDDETMLILEVHYAGKIFEELHYDSIYHEHLCYFTIESIEKLLHLHGLYAYDMMESPISGGSIVLYIKKLQEKKSDSLLLLQQNEGEYNSLEAWKKFADLSFKHRDLLTGILEEELKSNKKIACYGASARSSTMLNFCNIGYIEIIADKNNLKHNKYTPGSHMKIVSPDEMMKGKPEIIFILAWNFKDEIIKMLKEKYNFKGKIILPLPYPPIIEDIL